MRSSCTSALGSIVGAQRELAALLSQQEGGQVEMANLDAFWGQFAFSTAPKISCSGCYASFKKSNYKIKMLGKKILGSKRNTFI